MADRFTPGPWGFCAAENLYARGDISVSVVRDGSADGMLVVVVRDNSNREMQMANARLIAAAPELLAALRRAYDPARNDNEAFIAACEAYMGMAPIGDSSVLVQGFCAGWDASRAMPADVAELLRRVEG